MTRVWPTLISWGGFVLLLVAVAVMLGRRLHRHFPALFAYFILVILGEIVRRAFLLLFPVTSLQYFYAYWLTESVTLLAAFAALYEVFLIRLFPSFHTTPVYRYLFPTVIVAGVLLALFVFLAAPRRGPSLLAVLVGETTLALNVLQVALLLFFFVIVLLMGRGWEWHEFGIALGYGVYAISKLITTAVRAKAGYARTAVDQLPVFGYFAALVIWLIYLSREYKRPDIHIPSELVGKAASWNRLLRDVTGRRR